MPGELKDYLIEIANSIHGDDYRRHLNRSLMPELDEIERAMIINACNRITSVLKGKGKEEFIDEYRVRIRIREQFKRRYKDGLLNRKDSITYSDWSEATFDRKAKDIIIKEDGTKRYRIEDLDKIARLIIDSSKLALCIETHYSFDRYRRGFLPFAGGKYYRIVDEDERFVVLFNEMWDVIIKIPITKFRRYFRIKEDLDFDSHKFGGQDLRLMP